MSLELVVRCKDCGDEVDTWDLSPEDPATHICEVAGDLKLRHTCKPTTGSLMFVNGAFVTVVKEVDLERIREVTQRRVGRMRLTFDKELRKIMAEERMLRWFVYDHLPEPLQFISKQFSQLAHDMCERLKPGPERTVMLRKLLEAKDAAVRQQIEDTHQDSNPPTTETVGPHPPDDNAWHTSSGIEEKEP